MNTLMNINWHWTDFEICIPGYIFLVEPEYTWDNEPCGSKTLRTYHPT